ncbi:MAG: MgtC/SapB family protein [Lachnospiraceae bacterium]|nr:MgtC/SapB family protein [Lachnospiraceae bacterium]
MNPSLSDPFTNLLGSWATSLNICSVILRILIALIFSAIVGCERATKRHSAGVRTFMLMTMAPTLAALCDEYLRESLLGNGTGSFTFLPVLSGAAIIAGAVISINCILFSSRNQIKGLTTSVALWCCVILGMACGMGQLTIAIIGFISLLCTLNIFPTIEHFLKNRSNHFEIHLELKSSAYLQDFVTTIRKLGIIIDDIELNPAYVNSGLSVYSIALSITSGELKKYKTHKEIIEALKTLEYVYHIEEMRA